MSYSNIIEDGRSSRRTRSAIKSKQQNNSDLPPDFSGEELSGSSAHEDDGEEYEVSSQDSE